MAQGSCCEHRGGTEAAAQPHSPTTGITEWALSGRGRRKPCWRIPIVRSWRYRYYVCAQPHSRPTPHTHPNTDCCSCGFAPPPAAGRGRRLEVSTTAHGGFERGPQVEIPVGFHCASSVCCQLRTPFVLIVCRVEPSIHRPTAQHPGFILPHPCKPARSRGIHGPSAVSNQDKRAFSAQPATSPSPIKSTPPSIP